ncbi:prolyl oligopeptidase family serine peptidase [uncultured Friedmanniella sp.]|uniref:S9 family peptidase n=1 Tax=uncultured Friedmanniella sp. TaxID=335381 RepID=UPI0035C9F83E
MPTAPYGSWTSPITADHLTSASVGLSEVRVDGSDLYWLESRADQGGRIGVWRAPLAGGDPVEVTPGSANVRTRAHEYGGGAYDVLDGVVVYSDMTDGRLRVVRDGTTSEPITPAADLRYADLRVHPDLDLVLAVREDHRGGGEAINTIVALELAGPNADGGRVLCVGADFYATPELSPDGRLAWVQWLHPAMPWDATALLVGRLDRDPATGWRLNEPRQVGGGAEESAVQPRWLPDGTLLLLSDRTDWWNLYAVGLDDDQLRPLCPAEAEFCGPQWVFGQTPYAVLDADRLVCSITRSGVESVEVLRLSTGELTPVTPDDTGAADLAAGDGRVAAVLTHPDRPRGLAVLEADGSWTERRPSSTLTLPAAAISLAQPVHWPAPGETSSDGSGDVHGWYYPPTSADQTGPEGELPPLITLSHGGPTAFSSSALSLGYQFWTSRGYAVLDVNYGGSTGYGRRYRERLVGRWGLVDVADCAAGAVAMGERGLADPDRLAVKGGSAGGYTTLRALTATTVFAAGISQYGVGDLEALALHTHKFESRYLDGLVGPYPEARDVYLDRSPIHHLDALAAPILLLQGTDDKVVPPEQAEDMAAAARAQGLPVALLMFAGEGHGFRRAENIRASLDAQQYFLGQIFGFTPADDVPTIPIDNLS